MVQKIKIVLAIAFVILVLLAACSKNDPAKDEFAKCLADKGAIFYGAFWCPHCAEQKKLFGSSMEHINYIECSTPDKQGQTRICQEKDIQGYPTWEFTDGSRQSGVLSLQDLGQATGCSLTVPE